MTKIGIISDVHANPIALKKVLAQDTSVDEWYFLGDAAGYGPFPIEAILLLIKHVSPNHWLIGNHDAALLGLYEDVFSLPARQTIVNHRRLLNNKEIEVTTQPGINSTHSQNQNHVMKNYENPVFVSYAWGDESEHVVEELERAFDKNGIHIERDKKDLGFKDSIEAFEQRIGRGQCIILVISDKYLRSEHCMYELLEIKENGRLRDRVFPIVLADARIYKAIDRMKLIKYWDEQIKQLNQAIREIKIWTNLDGIFGDLQKYGQIRDNIDHLTNLLRDMNTLTPEMHASNDFSILVSAVERAIVSQQATSQSSTLMKQPINSEMSEQSRIGLYGWCEKFWTISSAIPQTLKGISSDYWFVHGMIDDWPNCIKRYVFPFQDEDSLNDIRRAFNNLGEKHIENRPTVLFCGHSHMPTYLFRPYGQNYYQYKPILLDNENSLNEDGTYIINIGSVGFSRISKKYDKYPYAYYVILDTSQNTFQFKRVDYEGDRLIEASNRQNAAWDHGEDGETVMRFYEAEYFDGHNKKEWDKVYRETPKGWEPIIDRQTL
jgi:hypothetical protein